MKFYILVSVMLIFMYIFYSNRFFVGFTSEAGSSEAGSSEAGSSEAGSSEAITGESLCSIYSSKPQELTTKCGELTEKNCNSTSCCLWLNGQSCVAGNANGPTFRTTGGKNIDIKYYSYKNKLVGEK
jgi:hypothetical protein